MAVAAPIYGATQKRMKAMTWCIISGIFEPLGAILVGLFLNPYLTNSIIQSSLAVVSGIMIFICFRELIPCTLQYIEAKSAIISNIFGMFFIFLSVSYLKNI
jgi:ZIP family zinc transporter